MQLVCFARYIITSASNDSACIWIYLALEMQRELSNKIEAYAEKTEKKDKLTRKQSVKAK